MITPYLPTLNLSVDNAMSLSQIVHQLITQLNNITKYVNEMDLGVDEKISAELKSYDERLQVQLEALQETLVNAISEASADCKNYTDLKSDTIYSAIETLETELKSYVDKYNEIQDKEIEVLKLEIESLRIALDEINKTQGSAVSPLTGTSKSVEDCIYDCGQLVSYGDGVTIGDMLRALYYDETMSNPDPNTTTCTITNVIESLSPEYTTNQSNIGTNKNLMDSFNYQTKPFLGIYISKGKYGLMMTGKKIIENEESSVVQMAYVANDILNSFGYATRKDCGYMVANTGTRVKFIDNIYLSLARDMGLLNEDFTIKTTGEYPL